MSRKTQLVFLVLALTITLGMTAITATMDLGGVGGSGEVEVSQGPLEIKSVNTSVNTTANPAERDVDVSVVQTADGIDRLSAIDLDDEFEEGDTFELQPTVRNNADSPLGIRLTTNTTDNVEIQNISSDSVDLAQLSSVNTDTAEMEFTLHPDEETTIQAEYNVTGEVGGPFDVDLFFNTVE